MYTVHYANIHASEYTLHGAAWTFLRIAKAAPSTYLPHITREDGSPLSEEEEADIDRAIDSIPHEDVTPYPVEM